MSRWSWWTTFYDALLTSPDAALNNKIGCRVIEGSFNWLWTWLNMNLCTSCSPESILLMKSASIILERNSTLTHNCPNPQTERRRRSSISMSKHNSNKWSLNLGAMLKKKDLSNLIEIIANVYLSANVHRFEIGWVREILLGEDRLRRLISNCTSWVHSEGVRWGSVATPEWLMGKRPYLERKSEYLIW